MVRNYTGDPIEEDVVDRLIEAARRAPSAGFSQGQYLLVVTSPETRQTIANLSGEAEYVAAGFDRWISKAPVHFVICTSEADYHRRYQEPDKVDSQGREMTWPIPYWWVDAGASMMLLLLAAVDEGLAAGLLGVHSIPGLRTLLGIPDEVTPIAVVTVGHPAPDRKSGSLDRGRRPEAEVVHREGWNSGGIGQS
jgi:nitroreductase